MFVIEVVVVVLGRSVCVGVWMAGMAVVVVVPRRRWSIVVHCARPRQTRTPCTRLSLPPVSPTTITTTETRTNLEPRDLGQALVHGPRVVRQRLHQPGLPLQHLSVGWIVFLLVVWVLLGCFWG